MFLLVYWPVWGLLGVPGLLGGELRLKEAIGGLASFFETHAPLLLG